MVENETVTSETWKIGTTLIFGRVILAPMEGISDEPYRTICRRLGSAISCTEFINAMDVLHGHPYRVDQRASFLPGERPVSIQLFDNEPDRIIKAAEIMMQVAPDFIDINMGCSAKKVSNRGAGAGLLRTPDKIETIFRELSRRLPVPVTGKIRLGWDGGSRNYLEIAKIIEQNGGTAIAVHGRTRKQAYSGQADWDAIAEVKQKSCIPVIANGDVKTNADIDRILSHTGCDAVMIGRAAVGNPWIFNRLEADQVPYTARYQIMKEHLLAMSNFYGEETGVILFRKHAVYYLKHYPMTREEKRILLSTRSFMDFFSVLDQLQLGQREPCF
jgi:tRNA-dihydrouridine synthase B